MAWERDIAIEQLHELGYEFGQKIKPTDKIESHESEDDIIQQKIDKLKESKDGSDDTKSM